ncbi:unnamed protein product [Malus baccata var. baccata]|uniref:glucose-1-phosphate adenylyltransferase n=1 Tax=Malus domestica TaxID=3750 RepID=A0A498HET5_MALDO|nr:hypothetical protein DVH24_027984 [Malus domestica]
MAASGVLTSRSSVLPNSKQTQNISRLSFSGSHLSGTKIPAPPPAPSVLGIILGGGAGTRLYPLTKKRAKPAVPLGANYRLIDIPVSIASTATCPRSMC